jgi:hypothetical protein
LFLNLSKYENNKRVKDYDKQLKNYQKEYKKDSLILKDKIKIFDRKIFY